MKKKKKLKFLAKPNNKTIITSLILLTTCYLAVPCGIWIIHHRIPEQICGNFSADGLLSYAGAIFGWLPTLILSLLTIDQARKNTELQEILEIDRKRQAIFPDLYINCNEENHINIINYSTNTANNLVISCDEYCGDEFHILPGNGTLKFELEYFPSRILLTYGDSIGSCIRREFVKSENKYILIKTEYDM